MDRDGENNREQQQPLDLVDGLEYPAPLRPDETWGILDSTKMKTLMRCPRKYFYEYILGWRIDKPNLHLEFGIAWHLAMEHLLDGYRRRGQYSEEDLPGAMERFIEHYSLHWDMAWETANSPKNMENAAKALQQYIKRFKNEEQIEVLFTEVAGTVPVTAQGHVLHFKIDLVFRDYRGILIRDHKTTGRDTKVWRETWQLDIQMTNYTHVLFMLFPENEVYGAEVNGAILRKGDNDFARIDIRKTKEMMQTWEWQTGYRLAELDNYHRRLAASKESDPVLTTFPRQETACGDYNSVCPYFAFCQAWSNPLQYAGKPPPGFKVEFWNPRKNAEEGARYKFDAATRTIEDLTDGKEEKDEHAVEGQDTGGTP